MSSPDLRQLEKQLLKRTKIERRSGPKPVRLSNLIAQTAWLDGQLLWRDGRVVFQVGEKALRIEDEDIRRTSRALERLEQRDLRRELVDLVASRRQKFGCLREIATVKAPDLKTLCSVSRRQNPKAIERLGTLLVVESLVPELLEHSPTRALALAWPLSQNVLESLAKSEVYPEDAKQFARFALSNRHFEFWQQDNNFPVGLCVRLGFSAYEMPEALKEVGPYSLSYCQINDLCQSGSSKQQVLEIVRALQMASNVWLEPDILTLPPVFNAKDLSAMRACYKTFARDSKDGVREALLQLAKHDSRSIQPATKFLIFWQWRWYATFSTLPKKRGPKEWMKGANEVFKAASSTVKRLENHECASDVFQFLLDRSRAFIGQTVPLNSHLNSLSELGLLCNMACVVGIETTNRLAQSDIDSLKPLQAHSEWLELAIEWFISCDGRSDFFCELGEARKRGNSISVLRAFGRDIEKEIRCLPPESRDWLFDYSLEQKWSRSFAQHLAECYRRYIGKIANFDVANHKVWLSFMPRFARVANEYKWEIETSVKVFEVAYECLKGHFDWAKEQEDAFDAMRAAQYTSSLVELHDVSDLEAYRSALRQAITWSLTSVGSNILWNLDKSVALSIASRKNLRRALLSVGRRTPRFVFEALPQMTSLKRLHLMDVFDFFEVKAPLQGEHWYRFLARYPQLENEIRDCFHWSKLGGEELTAPPISNRWRDYETKTPREMGFLRAKIVEQPQNLGLQKRLSTLEEQWQNRDVWLPNELRECLLDASSNSAKVAIQNAISSALRARLRVVCGELPPNLKVDNDWVNAILLACEVEENRKWAVTILRNCARILLEPETANWREMLEGNAKFLDEMRERGKNLDVYASRHERQIGDYTLWIESEPLQILQMGNRFDTCLSRGGINEHSAITNAIDSNKRVIYARQHSNIVGRQLLCVSEDFELLGYHVYSTFPSESKEKYSLNRAFHEYVSQFADQVGLEKADEGKVLTLCGASWYDDYEINWASLLEEPPAEKPGSKSRDVKYNSTRLSAKSTHNTPKMTNSLRHTRGNDSSNSGVGFPALASS